MDFNHINYFDAAVIGIMLLSCLFAFFRGLVREILSLAAWIGAGIVTIYYFPGASAKLQEHFKSPMVAAGIATVGIYLAALLVFGLINTIIFQTIRRGEDGGMLDNLLGLIFGAFRGAVIIAFGYFLISVALPEKEFPEWMRDAKTRPYAEKGSDILKRLAPQYVSELEALQKKAVAEAQGNPPAGNTASGTTGGDVAPGADTSGGYSRQVSGQLDRLIDSQQQPGPAR